MPTLIMSAFRGKAYIPASTTRQMSSFLASLIDSMPGKEVLMAEKSTRPRDGGAPSQDPCEQGTVKGDGCAEGKLGNCRFR